MDRSCRPQPTCTVNSFSVSSLNLWGYNSDGDIVKTKNGKKYFIGLDESSISYDSAALICCKLNMSMAEFTTQESWDNFYAFAKVQTFSSWNFFGQTTDNGNKTDTWCKSGTLVPDGIIPERLYNLTCGTKSLAILTPGGNRSYTAPTSKIHRYFCE
ncbi:Hypothetical predicted protein [Cloeon dipterum]|uniref:C-type lectin domain-containing protein n=1 Tax=Cloeon dipterum TaxID=197152 RepID=A0A8S1DGI2_9INSE|nr:Hypothetical predicted protein [Cloeon dipterum]